MKLIPWKRYLSDITIKYEQYQPEPQEDDSMFVIHLNNYKMDKSTSEILNAIKNKEQIVIEYSVSINPGTSIFKVNTLNLISPLIGYGKADSGTYEGKTCFIFNYLTVDSGTNTVYQSIFFDYDNSGYPSLTEMLLDYSGWWN